MSKSTEKRYSRDEPHIIDVVQSDEGNLVKLLVEPFWKNRPDLWFNKIEAQFSNCDIYEDITKYNIVISLLDEETALEVKDIIIGPPSDDKYGFLKEQLMKRLTAKNEEEAKKRMMAEVMGDRTPSEFYSYLSVLAGCYVRDKFVEEVWLECLPSKIKSVVECLKNNELDTLVTVADRVHKVFFSPPTEQQANTPVTSALLECLVKEVENLKKKVQMLKPSGSQCSARSKSKDREVKCIPPLEPQKNVVDRVTQYKPCQYHTKYGVKLCKMRRNCN